MKLIKHQASWIEFIEIFHLSSNIKKCKDNIVVDTLSRRYTLVFILEAKMFGFEYMKGLYDSDNDFATF